MRYRMIFAAIAATTLLAGCGSSKDASKSNFQTAIDKAMTKDCVVVGPGVNLFAASHAYPVSMALSQPNMFQNPDQTKKINDRMTAPYEALVKAGLLEGKDDQVPMLGNNSQKVPGRTYAVTETGKKFLVDADRTTFCAAHYKVDEVTEFTQPGTAMGGQTMSMAKFTYSAVDIADWAKSDDVKAVYTDLNKSLTPKREGRAELVLMNDGWTAHVQHGFF